MKIYISPSDQSNQGVGNYGLEKDRMQQLSNLLVPLLQARHTIYGGMNTLNLNQRIAASNNANVDIHIALHSNGGGGTGPETWHHTNSSNGLRLATVIQSPLQSLRGHGRGVRPSTGYLELNQVNAPAVIVEVSFHDNQSDVNWMLNNWANIAQTIANGVNTY